MLLGCLVKRARKDGRIKGGWGVDEWNDGWKTYRAVGSCSEISLRKSVL